MPFIDGDMVYFEGLEKITKKESRILADIYKMHLREDGSVPIHMKKYLDSYWQSKLKFI
jgi:hypothetical protein